MLIKGVIVAETPKALCVEIHEDAHKKLIGKSPWFPKTKVRLVTNKIELDVPKWVYDQKVNE